MESAINEKKEIFQNGPIYVLKFGGTSMGSFQAMQYCAEVVLGYGILPHHSAVVLPANADKYAMLSGQIHLAVVVSAVAGVTDLLQKFFTMSKETLQKLRYKHERIVAECALHFGLKDSCIEEFFRLELDELFIKLEQSIKIARPIICFSGKLNVFLWEKSFPARFFLLC